MENGECTAVKNRVSTSTNCAPNPTEKYLTSYIKLGLKNQSQITYFKKKNRDCFCPTENATNTYIKYFTVCLNQITFMVNGKRNGLTFTERLVKIGLFLPLSPRY